MNVVDYYELLGVPRNADAVAIKDAVRKTRKRFRQLEGAPDMNQRQMAETKMTQIAAAEKTLLDDAARQQYDQQLAQQAAQPKTQTQSQSSESAASFLDDARNYYRDGHLENASLASKEATRMDKGSFDAWYIRAQISLELGDYSDADFSANQALKLKSDNALIYGVLGDIADCEFRYADAEKYFNSAAQLEPNNYYWPSRVVWVLGDQKLYDDALSIIRLLYKKYPQEEYVKATYVNMLLGDIENAASHSDNGMYFYTNKKQIEYARKRMLEIRSLGDFSNNPDLLKNIEEHSNFIEQAVHRKFVWQGLGYYVTRFILWLVLFALFGPLFIKNTYGDIVGNTANVMGLIITVGMIWLVYERTFPYQWKVNKKAAGTDAKTGLQE